MLKCRLLIRKSDVLPLEKRPPVMCIKKLDIGCRHVCHSVSIKMRQQSIAFQDHKCPSQILTVKMECQ